MKAIVRSDAIWTTFMLPEVSHRPYKRRVFMTHGLGGLYRLMTAVDGFSVVGRATFVAHCCALEPGGAGLFAQFAALCFRLRICDQSDVRTFYFLLVLLYLYIIQINNTHANTHTNTHERGKKGISHTAPAFGD